MTLPMNYFVETVAFNYGQVKLEYVKKLNNLDSSNPIIAPPLSRYRENILIRRIKKCSSPIYDEILSNLEETTKIPDAKIDIAKEHGVYVLIFANSNKQILPFEDCFDVFVDLHLRESHAGFNDMYDILQNYFSFPKQVLECFLQSCNVCNTQLNKHQNHIEIETEDQNKFVIQNPPPPDDNIMYDNLNLNVHIIFLQMHSKAGHVNDDFKYMLVYRQEKSGYILLRPLIELNAEEVALELYNIFVDIGPPVVIQTTHSNLLREVLGLLQQTPIKYSYQVIDSRFANDPLTFKITNYINAWMEECDESNWAAGCYIVQFTLNTEADKPMEKLFGPRIGQSSKLQVLLPDEKKTKKGKKPKSTQSSCSRSEPTESVSAHESTPSNDTEDLKAVEVTTDSASKSGKSLDTDNAQKTACTEGNPEKDEKICQVCYRVIMFKFETCGQCNELVHLFCGQRSAIDIKSFEGFHVICNNCRKLK